MFTNTPVGPDHADFLRDESRRTGSADFISFPKNEEDVHEALAAARAASRTVTLQGARTGITGGAVPAGGSILNLTRMSRVLGIEHNDQGFVVTAEPGLRLADLYRILRNPEAAADEVIGQSAITQDEWQTFADAGRFFFAPDLTETSASVGGLVACNASGARSFSHGAVRRHVQSLRLMLADGSVLSLQRGQTMANGRTFAVTTEDGRTLRGTLPSYRMPSVKNAAGYYVADGMDMIDLWVGAEGTLGVVLSAGLQLLPLPPVLWGIVAFLPTEQAATEFVIGTRAKLRPMAMEWFGESALELLKEIKRAGGGFTLVRTPPEGRWTAVYVELPGGSAADVEASVEILTGILSDCGGDIDKTWLASSEDEIQDIKNFRHAVPEAVNLLIDERRKTEPGLTKLGTDLAVPDDALRQVLAMYRDGLQRAGLQSVVFGHVGDNHVHVNIIPRTLAEYETGRALYLKWARTVVALGGTVSAEHGIGKLKTAMLREMYGEDGIRQMRELKRKFDPGMMLNPGNLFDPKGSS
jgi:D-lactate dehydrogenase (cytochrome)